MSEAILSQILSSLNRIEQKVDDNHKEITGRLNRHMEEEEGEIGEIRDLIDTNRIASEQRHTNLIQSINSYTDKMADRQAHFEEAFLKIDGKPDLHGHRDDHHSRRALAQKIDKWRDEAVGNVVKVGTLGAIVWLLYAIWDALLRGHK